MLNPVDQTNPIVIPTEILFDLCEAATQQNKFCERSFEALHRIHALWKAGQTLHPIVVMQPSIILQQELLESLLASYQKKEMDLGALDFLAQTLSNLPRMVILPIELDEALIEAHLSGKVFQAYVGSTRPATAEFRRAYGDVILAVKKLMTLKP